MSHAVKVLQGSLRRLMIIQVALALLTAIGFYINHGGMVGVAALFGGAIALFNSLISARQLARASQNRDATRQMAELYFGAAMRFLATPALVAVGIAALGLNAIAIIVGFAVPQIAYFFGDRQIGQQNSH
ncbi:ATP synthase subunit I [Endothiovibrio diazotrophicus]